MPKKIIRLLAFMIKACSPCPKNVHIPTIVAREMDGEWRVGSLAHDRSPGGGAKHASPGGTEAVACFLLPLRRIHVSMNGEYKREKE